MFKACEKSCQLLLFVTLTVNELPVKMGVASWVWSILINSVWIGTPSCPLINRAPSSNSMADSNTLHMMENYTYIGMLGYGSTVDCLVGSSSWGPTKKISLCNFVLLQRLNGRHRCGYIISCHWLCIKEWPWEGLHRNSIKM